VTTSHNQWQCCTALLSPAEWDILQQVLNQVLDTPDQAQVVGGAVGF
jgi:hypothetical protein